MEGRFSTTSKNFSKTASNATSPTAGFGSPLNLVATNVSVAELFVLTDPLTATLCFFKNAAEKPEAQT